MRKLISGIVEFRERELPKYAERFRELALTQSPDALLITCSDSRVVPDLLASTHPGDLFTMRNVGNLIPPATAEGVSIGDVSEASAIEYAVLVLKVANIVVCGHSECGAMKAVLARNPKPDAPNLEKWLHHASTAAFRLEHEGALDSDAETPRPAVATQCAGAARASDVLPHRARAGRGGDPPFERLVVRYRHRRHVFLRARKPLVRGHRPPGSRAADRAPRRGMTAGLRRLCRGHQ